MPKKTWYFDSIENDVHHQIACEIWMNQHALNDVMHRVQNHICEMWFIKQKLAEWEDAKANKTKPHQTDTSMCALAVLTAKVIFNGKKYFAFSIEQTVCGSYRNTYLLCPTDVFFSHISRSSNTHFSHSCNSFHQLHGDAISEIDKIRDDYLNSMK